MTPRLRRLRADADRLMAFLEGNQHIKMIEAVGTPPERYVLEYHLDGLVPSEDGSPRTGDVHRAEVFLPLDYPRRPPFCRMTTPVFHPNIDPQKICIGDHWSAGQSLVELVARIAQMICYQSYNTQSPLNGLAAAWVTEHAAQVPLEAVDLVAGL